MGEMADYILDTFVFGPDLPYEDYDEVSMSIQYSGKIISLKKTRKGFRIDDPQGNQMWFSTQWELDEAQYRGAEVAFTYTQNGKWLNVDAGSLNVTKAPEPYQGGGGKGKGGYRKGGGYDSEGQRRGNALTNATSIVCALINKGKIESGKEASDKAVKIANYLLKQFDPKGSTPPAQQPPAQQAPPPQSQPAPQQNEESDDDMPW